MGLICNLVHEHCELIPALIEVETGLSLGTTQSGSAFVGENSRVSINLW